MKYIGIVLILFASILFGSVYSEKMNRPADEVREFLRFLRFMKERVVCYLEPPSKVACSFSSELLESSGFLPKLRSGAGLHDAFIFSRANLSAGDEELGILSDFFERSGRGYLEGELKLIDTAIGSLERALEGYSERSRTRGKSVKAISVAVGLGISLLLI